MVKMSLAEYIDRKIKDVDINVDLSDYESNLRDGLMDKKSRRELYWLSERQQACHTPEFPRKREFLRGVQEIHSLVFKAKNT